MKLNKILEQIEILKPFLSEDVDGGPLNTLAARRGRRRQAVDQLKELEEQYTQEMMKFLVIIAVVGTGRNEFVDVVATPKFGCFGGDAEDFYRRLADKIPGCVYLNKDTGTNLFDIIGRHLEDLCIDLNIMEYPMLVFKNQYKRVLKSKEDLLSVLKQAINEQIGGEIVGIAAARSLAKTAIERRHGAATTAIVLTAADEQLLIDILKPMKRLTPNVFLVAAGKPPRAAKGLPFVAAKNLDDDSVADVLTTVKRNLK